MADWTDETLAGHRISILDVPQPLGVVICLPDIDGTSPGFSDLWTRLFVEHKLCCVCPDGSDSWWADRLLTSFDPERTAADFFRDKLLPWVAGHFPAMKAPALIGLGAGGQAALRFAFQQPSKFPVVAGLAGAIDHYELHGRGSSLDELYPTRESCRQDGVMLHVHPVKQPASIFLACSPDDPWFRGNDRLHEKLMALGVPHETDFTTRVCGHSWSYYEAIAPRLFRFLSESLRKDARKLV
jgi:S-formylglutathione hydrolase FrmB